MARKPATPAPRRAETFEERTARINKDIERTNQRTGAVPRPTTVVVRRPPVTAVVRRPAPTPPPSPYGQSTVPGNVPRPAVSPTSARDVPLGSGLAGRARQALLTREERLRQAEEEAVNGGKPRPMAGGGMVKGMPMGKGMGKGMPCGKKRK